MEINTFIYYGMEIMLKQEKFEHFFKSFSSKIIKKGYNPNFEFYSKILNSNMVLFIDLQR